MGRGAEAGNESGKECQDQAVKNFNLYPQGKGVSMRDSK